MVGSASSVVDLPFKRKVVAIESSYIIDPDSASESDR
jgi:hypothetical protein